MKENGLSSVLSFYNFLYLFSNLQTCAANALLPHLISFPIEWNIYYASNRILALRKAEKEEEKRAREKIRQKLEEDKVYIFPVTLSGLLMNIFILGLLAIIHFILLFLMHMSKCSSLYMSREILYQEVNILNPESTITFFPWLIVGVLPSWLGLTFESWFFNLWIITILIAKKWMIPQTRFK